MGYIIEYHWLGNLNKRHLFLKGLGTGKSQIKSPPGPVCLVGAHFLIFRWLSAHCILMWWRTQREESFHVFFYKGTNPSAWGLYTMTYHHSNSPHPSTIPLGLGFQCKDFGRTHSVHRIHAVILYRAFFSLSSLTLLSLDTRYVNYS